jgi:DNA-binding PadR family transcriptional regulator
MTASEISSTEAAILGLLRLGERSGYDLSKMVRGSVGYFWSPAQSQIYAVLPRLVQAGLATRRGVRQTGKPDKQIYRITKRGIAALDAWLNDPETEPAAVKNPFLLKLFLGEFMSREAVIAHIKQARAEAAAELEELEQIRPDTRAHPYDGLVLGWGLERGRAFVRWADRAIREIEGEPVRRPRRRRSRSRSAPRTGSPGAGRGASPEPG